jgi:hypothetical protein
MIAFLWLVVLLSPAVMSVIQVFPSLWYWVWLVLSFESVGLPFVVMWGDRGEIRWCGLSKILNGGEGCDFHGLWFIMLKYGKDRVIGVDTLGQQVPPRVRYGTACLIIRDVMRSLSCSDEWEFGVITRLGSHDAREPMVPWLPRETLASLWYCVLP